MVLGKHRRGVYRERRTRVSHGKIYLFPTHLHPVFGICRHCVCGQQITFEKVMYGQRIYLSQLSWKKQEADMLDLVPLVDAHRHPVLLVTIAVMHSGTQRVETLQTGVCRQPFKSFRRKSGSPGLANTYGKCHRNRNEELSKHGFVPLKKQRTHYKITCTHTHCYHLCTLTVLPSFLYRVTKDGLPLSNTPSMRSPLSAITSFVLTTL